MKRLLLIVSLVMVPLVCVVRGAAAQTVTFDRVSKTLLCFGDTVWVHYTAAGAFNSDNFFEAQLSDASGSFVTFINYGRATAMSDSIPLVIGHGDHYRVRVISTSPYSKSATTSSDIQVVGFPEPRPSPNGNTNYGAAGFEGDPILFRDAMSEPSGTTYFWDFDSSDANVRTATTDSVYVVYPTEGIKTGWLTVTNAAGCSRSQRFVIRILTCHPVIPHDTYVVTTQANGDYAYVWVKSGASYSATGENKLQTVFVEPGGAFAADFRTIGLYYLKPGSSFFALNNQGAATIVLDKGETISLGGGGANDTLYCNNLTFEQEGAEVDQTPIPHLAVSNTKNGLFAHLGGARISVSIFDPLGHRFRSFTGTDELAIDLSTLPNGIYFALIESGRERVMRKVVVP